MFDIEIKFKDQPWKPIGAAFPFHENAEHHLNQLKEDWKKSRLGRPTGYRIILVEGEPEIKDDIEAQTIEELHKMVQESKRLLMRWRATSRLSKAAKLELRRETNAYLRKSSTAVLSRWYDARQQ